LLSTVSPSRQLTGRNTAIRHRAASVSIPPGQSRYLRITWISHGCLAKLDDAGMDSVRLRVRVGWVTRTEYIQFHECFFLGHSGHCPRPQPDRFQEIGS